MSGYKKADAQVVQVAIKHHRKIAMLECEKAFAAVTQNVLTAGGK